MSIDLNTYTPRGDKKNSDFFNEFRIKIYDRRKSAGLDKLIQHMHAIIIQVCTGDAVPYMAELTIMGPYRYTTSFRNTTHFIHILSVNPQQPYIVVLEPISATYVDNVTTLNMLYPRGREKPNARYIGEIYKTQDLTETVNILQSQDFRFETPDDIKNPFYLNEHTHFTLPSYFTANRVGYTDKDFADLASLELGEAHTLSDSEKDTLRSAEALHDAHALTGIVKGVDHLATRIFAGEREDALLEYLALTNYYFWGAYNIGDMNSSTNVTRHPTVETDIHSPARVFTANNTPYFVNSFEKHPMPTEDFVRNFGRRMHHMAYEVVDGDHGPHDKNIDFVVGELKKMNVDFLDRIFGECKDKPDLKQIFSHASPYSILITEYVERCHGFDGFFTKDNVAELTAAAGKAEGVSNPVGPLGD